MKKKYDLLQVEDFQVREENGVMVFGKRTPLLLILPPEFAKWIVENPHFREIDLVDYYEHEDGENYHMHYRVFRGSYSGGLTVRISIDTRGNFRFDFDY